jgi:hypothetical protein
MDNHGVPLSRALLAALALAVGLGLAACGGGSSDETLIVPTTTQQFVPGAGGGAAGAAAAAQFGNVGSRAAMMANTPMSRLLLSGKFKPPAGFTLLSVNPSIPLGLPAYGAVRAILTSPTGVEYDVMFGPPTVPCITANCTSSSRTVPVGSANPQPTAAVFAPDVGRSAECGYDPDSHQVGCDTIVNDEYISVRANALNVSTTDAVAVLRAAIVFVESVGKGP